MFFTTVHSDLWEYGESHAHMLLCSSEAIIMISAVNVFKVIGLTLTVVSRSFCRYGTEHGSRLFLGYFSSVCLCLSHFWDVSGALANFAVVFGLLFTINSELNGNSILGGQYLGGCSTFSMKLQYMQWKHSFSCVMDTGQFSCHFSRKLLDGHRPT